MWIYTLKWEPPDLKGCSPTPSKRKSQRTLGLPKGILMCWHRLQHPELDHWSEHRLAAQCLPELRQHFQCRLNIYYTKWFWCVVLCMWDNQVMWNVEECDVVRLRERPDSVDNCTCMPVHQIGIPLKGNNKISIILKLWLELLKLLVSW